MEVFYTDNEGQKLYSGFMAIGDREATEAEVQAYMIKRAVPYFTNKTTEFIQSKVSLYNDTNGLAFTDIDAFAKYALVPACQHYGVAIQFITWASLVWEAVRAYQSTATGVPTDEDFQALLESVPF